MHAKLTPLQESLDRLLESDLSHEENFGLQNGFHEVNAIKNEAVNYYLGILREADDVVERLPDGYVDRELQKLSLKIGELERYREQVVQIAAMQTSDQNFHKQRDNLHNQAKKFQSQYQAPLYDFQVAVIGAKAGSAVDSLDLKAQSDEVSTLLSSLRESEKKAEGIVETLRDSAARETYAESKSSFASLSTAHSNREWSWFWASAAAVVTLFVAVGSIIWGEQKAETTPEAVLIVFRKLILVGAPLFFLRISLTKYNAERHLRILYDHRNAAIAQLQLLEAAIDDDVQAKADLRLEAAKMILSDPNTAYASKGADGAEVNISPVFSAIEKVATKSSSQ